MRREVKLIIGAVVTLALLISGVAYFLLIERPSVEAPAVVPHEASTVSVETVLLRSEERTRTENGGGYWYEVRFYDASDNEVADVVASIRRGRPSAPEYRLTVAVLHHIEHAGYGFWIGENADPSVTHLEWLSLKFSRQIRQIPTVPSHWAMLTPETTTWNPPFSFSLESSFTVDAETSVLLLNFTQLRHLDIPSPSDGGEESSSSFEFLIRPSVTLQTHFNAFTLEISFTLHRMLDEGKVISHYEKGTTKPLEFQAAQFDAASLASSITSEAAAPTPMLPLSMHSFEERNAKVWGMAPTHMTQAETRLVQGL